MARSDAGRDGERRDSKRGRYRDIVVAMNHPGDLGMLATGLSYYRTISACLDLFDYDRANDWIDAIAKLPGPDQHGFPGDCLVHQVAVRIVRGEWAEARLEAEIAIADTERVDVTHAGPAWYELGELRLRVGELADAAEAFRRAHELYPRPCPTRSRVGRSIVGSRPPAARRSPAGLGRS